MKAARVVVGALLLSVAGVGVSVAQQYEQPADRRAADVVSPEVAKGPHHRVQDPVLADGYMYRFNVKSDFGAFDVTGSGALRKVAQEIYAIAKLREIKATSAFAAAVKDSATGPFRFGKSLITNPADTLTGIPKGAWKFMEEGATAITSEKDPSDDPAYKKALLVSGRKRDYAAQLNVDPYSSNTVLQKELNSVAWAAAIGNLTVSAALAPVGGPAGAALSAVRWGNTLNDLLKVEPPSRLRIINEGKLQAMGIPSDLGKRFLDHPVFSPRHDLILVESLSRLGSAKGREQFLEVALGATDEVDANFFTNTAQLLRGYHEAVSPIVGIQMVGGRLAVAQAQNGNAVVPLPIDHLIWTQAASRRAQEVKSKYQAAGFNGKFDLWLTGTVSPTARQGLSALGMTVAEQAGRRVEIID